MPETRDDRIKALIDDIKDISLVLLDPKEWARQEAIRELRREDELRDEEGIMEAGDDFYERGE